MYSIILYVYSIQSVPIILHLFFFFNDTATTEIYTLSLHDALPISKITIPAVGPDFGGVKSTMALPLIVAVAKSLLRSEEHTSELQSRQYLVCRLLLEKKKKKKNYNIRSIS